MKAYLLKDVPEDLWRALRSDAASRGVPSAKRLERSGTSLNNVVCEVLAGRYSLEFSPTKRATYDNDSGLRQLYVRMPEDIFDAVRREGVIRSVILLALGEHYELEVDARPRRAQRVKHGRPRGRKVKR